jgi:hypothetical protein
LHPRGVRRIFAWEGQVGTVTLAPAAQRPKADGAKPSAPFRGAGAAAGIPAFLRSTDAEPTEQLEREADTFADSFERSERVNATAGAPPASDDGGDGLPTGLRRALERPLAADLGGVRVHHDARAAAWSRSLGANAFTVGSGIYFAAGSYQPHTSSGRRLIAHEVAHTAQQRPFVQRNGDGTSVDVLESPPECQIGVSLAGMEVVPLGDPVYQPTPRQEEQVCAMLLRRIAPDRYRRDLPAQALAHLEATGGYVFRAPPTTEGEVPRILPTRVDLSVSFRLVDWLARTVGREDESLDAWLRLTPEQIELLQLGVDVEIMWRDFQNPEYADFWIGRFPRWYDQTLLLNDLQQHGQLLRNYHERGREYAAAGSSDPTDVIFAQNSIMAALLPAAQVLERIRREPLLFGDADFRELWRLPPLAEGTPPDQVTGPGEEQSPDPGAAFFLGFIRTQPGLRDAVLADEAGEPPPTVELFTRFARFVGRLRPSDGVSDRSLADAPSDRNAEALPASINAYPELEAPLFDAALGTDHVFALDVSFSDVYERLANSFGGYLYRWEIIEVPSGSLDDIEETAEAAPGTGTEVGWADTWGARMSRQGRYAVADVERVADAMDPIETTGTARDIQRLVHLLGAPFVGPTSLVALNAAIRTVGEVFSTVIEMVTEPRHEKHVVFPRAGLWIVRGYCTPNLDDDSEFRRATSVAWIPVFARSAEDMARLRLEQTIGRSLMDELTLTDTLMRLEEMDERGEEYDQLVATRDALDVELYGSVEDVLRQQREGYETRLRTDTALDEATREALSAAIDRIDEQLATRAARDAESGTERLLEAGVGPLVAAIGGIVFPTLTPLISPLVSPLVAPLVSMLDEDGGRLARAERVRAVFVSDTGTIIRPLMEAVTTAEGDRFACYVSDSTSPNSGDASGSGDSRADALMAALTSLFESASGYGRGELQVYIPSADDPSMGEIRHQRIEADLTAIGMETIENVSLIVTIAAMVAAPFTGGASLAILVPVGIVGAIPSAYRLADRAESATLRWDTQTCLDLLNVVAAFAGVAAEGAGVLRAVPLQRFLGVLGTGLDGLTMVAVSYDIIEQIQALDPNMSEGQRRAAIMRLMGSEMQAIGMQAAGRLVGHADMLSRTADGDGPTARTLDEPTTRIDEPTPRVEAEPVTLRSGDEPTVASPEPVRRRSAVVEESLPADLRGRVRVESDSSLTGSTVEVRYETDAWGMVSEVIIRHAEGAEAGVGLHHATARQLVSLSRISGRIRTLLNRFLLWAGLPSAPVPGTVAFDAMMEVRKLPEVIRSRMADVEARGIDDARLAEEIDSLQAQLRTFEAIYAEFRFTGEGGGASDGTVAARSPHDWLRRELGERRGTRGTLREIPAGWSGAHEASWLRYPPAEPGYHWRLRMEEDGPRLTYARNDIAPGGEVRPARAYDAVNGRFVDVGDAPLSRVSTDAIRDGLPPPPEGHYYVRRDGEYELRRTEAEGTVALELYRREDGAWDFRPRTDDLPTIGRRDYRGDFEAGETRAADLAVDEEFAAAIARRDAAIRDTVAAEGALPPRPDPSDTAAYRAWEELPEVRAARQLRNRIATGSRDAGMVAADIHVRRRWEGAERIYPPATADLATWGSQSGDFDLVYRVGDRIVVIEAKGGGSGIGTRRVEGGYRAEQGTREYFESVRDNMADMDGAAGAVGRELRRTAYANIDYLHVQLDVVTVGGRTEVRGLRVRAFDISAGGVRPP